METELGVIMAEGFRDQLRTDIVLLGSGSIRKPSLGPIVTLRDFKEIYPFTQPILRVILSGAQLRHGLKHMMREEAFETGAHTEWYQLSGGLRCEYDRPSQTIISLSYNGREMQDDDLFTVALTNFHVLNIESFLDLKTEEVEANGKPVTIASSKQNVLQEYFVAHPRIEYDGIPRLIIHS
ncbi:MAG: 5'-nucleotidase C-terminal domain-containing protein [Solobacterium sp.]|nr:5'-nucleotidase C-terminal domain-containing protein [Solobacterium sp.]